MYMEDNLYLDIIAENIVHVPIRFDFDKDDDLFIPKNHSYSHLTLGQYTNCRIPVSKPISPNEFCDFIFRNFYSNIFKELKLDLIFKIDNCVFPETIHKDERGIFHLYRNYMHIWSYFQNLCK